MAKVIGVNTAKSADQTIYDPTCGSGSLLLKAHDEECKLLNEFLDLLDQEAAASKRLKDAQKTLEIDVNAKYHTLSESEIKDLVVEDKWLKAIEIGIKTELECISQRLTGRITELSERYTTPLSSLEQEVEPYRLKVENHLKRMGFDWQAMTSKCEGVIA